MAAWAFAAAAVAGSPAFAAETRQPSAAFVVDGLTTPSAVDLMSATGFPTELLTVKMPDGRYVDLSARDGTWTLRAKAMPTDRIFGATTIGEMATDSGSPPAPPSPPSSTGSYTTGDTWTYNGTVDGWQVSVTYTLVNTSGGGTSWTMTHLEYTRAGDDRDPR